MGFGKRKETKKEEPETMTATPTEIGYVAELRPEFRKLLDDIAIVQIDSNSALMTPKAMASLMERITKNDAEDVYDLVKYIPKGAEHETIDTSQRAHYFSQKQLCLGAIRLAEMGVIDEEDLDKVWGTFINLGDNVKCQGKSDKKLTFNGIWLFFVRGGFFLVGYKSHYANGQQYMSPFEMFSIPETHGILHELSVGYIVGMDVAKAKGKACYTTDNLIRDYKTKFKYGIFAQRVSTGVVDYATKPEYELLKKVLPMVLEPGNGLNNILAKIDWCLANNLYRASQTFETQKLTDEEIAEIEFLEYDDVDETFPEFGRQSVPDFNPEE